MMKIADYVRNLKKKTHRHQTLLELWDAPSRDEGQTKLLRSLLEEERARNEVRVLRKRVDEISKSSSGKLRRRRTSALIAKGGLVKVAGAENASNTLIIGCLMQISNATPEMRARWEKMGSERLEAAAKQKGSKVSDAIAILPALDQDGDRHNA